MWWGVVLMTANGAHNRCTKDRSHLLVRLQSERVQSGLAHRSTQAMSGLDSRPDLCAWILVKIIALLCISRNSIAVSKLNTARSH